MLSWPRQALDSFLHLLYPPLCLYCDSALQDPALIFCEACTHLLHCLDPSHRCRYCFQEMDGPRQPLVCGVCAKQPAVFHGLAATFDYVGPAACLVKRMKYGNQPHLASGAAAFMVAQFTTLGWPLPDVIVPAPMPWIRQITRGYNQSQCLADEIGNYLQCPVVNALHRRSGDFSQAGLSHEQRKQLAHTTFQLKPGNDFTNQCVLLVDDVTTSGTTFRRCADALLHGAPAQLYALAFCVG